MTFLVLLSLLSPGGSLQTAGQESVVVSATVEPAVVDPGGEVLLRIKATIPRGFHIYGVNPPEASGVPTSVTLEDSLSFRPVGPLREPEPVIHYDEVFEVHVPWHGGEPVFTLPLRVFDSLTPGRHTLRGYFGYQLCDERSCRIPAEVQFEAPLTVRQVSSTPSEEPPAIVPAITVVVPSPPDSATPKERAPKVVGTFVGYDPTGENFLAFLRSKQGTVTGVRQRGTLPFVGAAILAGLLSLLTPCVFPMIPITVAFFTRMASGGRGESLLLAATYAAGIVAAYTAVGVVVSVVWGSSGVQSVASSPVTNLALAAVLLFFTLNLLGVFEIRLSAGPMGTPQRQGRTGRLLAVLLMALGFSLASFTCTAGFVGALLVAASQGEVWWPLVGMLAYSVAFAAPFFLLALFPAWLSSLPQAGGWMNRVKVSMGFIVFAATFKFLANADAVAGWGILGRPAVLTIWTVTFLFLGLYLLGAFRLPHDDPAQGALSVPRMFASLASCAVALHLAFGLAGHDVWAPLNGLLPPPETKVGEEWPQDFDTALAEARHRGLPLLIDFSGYTCTNCKLMEQRVFTLPAVERELSKFVRVRLYTDGGPDKRRNQRLAQELGGTLALPLYVILQP